MDPAQLLRERERRLIAEYRASRPPRAFDTEDLLCEDPEIVEHWIGVYTELVEFVHSVIDDSARDHPARAPDGLSGIELHARLLELHLAYWTDRLDRLSGDGDPERGEASG